MFKKKCTICKLLRFHTEFIKDKRTKDGLYSHCKFCHRKFTDNWLKRNPDYLKIYYQSRREEKINYVRMWRIKNHSKFLSRVARHARFRWKTDIKFRLNQIMGSFLYKSLKGKMPARTWEKLVGYTLEELMKHLEAQFDNKMNWNNYGFYWSIDHIKPKSLFQYKKPEGKEFKECWSLVNLQPMEKIANMQKGNKY